MARKKCKQESQVVRPVEFRTTPFVGLKEAGVVSLPRAPAPASATVLPVAAAPQQDDGLDLFFEAMTGVTRIGVSSLREPSSRGESHKPVRRDIRREEVEREADELFAQEIKRLRLDVKFEDSSPDEDELKPLAANRLRQLKRGVIRVDYQMDLHGLTRDEALAALPPFLRSARLRGQKAVLVITGKGLNSPGEPVLQQAVASWLREAGREMVVEFAPAPREMGGGGAFVVFLRASPPQ